MSLHDCLQRAIDSGDLPPRQARKAQELFAERLTVHAHLGQGAEAMAAQDVWIALRHQNIKKRRAAVMQIKANMGLAENLARHRDSDGQANAASGLRQMVEWGQSANHQSVASTASALEASYMRDIGDLLADQDANIWSQTFNIRANRARRARMDNIVREMKGEGSGDTNAREIAEAMTKTIDRARQEFNAAGGEIGKLEGYDLPHNWDRQRVARISADEFAAKLENEIDWARIIDRKTEQPFTRSSRAARVDFLKRVHDNIRTGGWNKREPSGQGLGKSLGKSRSDHRILHFKSANGWLKVNAELGQSDPFAAAVEHLKNMARETAIMRTFGPNPVAGMQYAKQTVMKLAVERPWQTGLTQGPMGSHVKWHSDAQSEAAGVAKQVDRMMDQFTGRANQPEMDVVANMMAGTRHFLVASQLGGAMLSAVSDSGFMALASRHVGMNPPKVLARMVKTLALPENRAMLARAGIIADAASSTAIVQSRFMGETYGPKVMQRLSEFTLRASGLSAWTDINRGVFKLEFYGHLADNAGKSWANLDPHLRDNVLAMRGITPEEWDIIRATGLHRDPAEPDATFLIPDDIRRRDDLDPDQALDLSLKLSSAIQEQMEFAIPSASLRGRSALQFGNAGTLGGEFMRSVLMYKNFTMSLMFNQLGRVLFHKARGNRFGNVMLFAMATTAAGAVSLQLKDIAAGRDPRPMNDSRFWKAALIQGGGAGIFGDFLYASENRFGGGFAGTAAGPMVGFASDAGKTFTGLVQAYSDGDPGKKDTAERQLLGFLNRNAGPTNLWYMNTAFDRLVWDSLQDWSDADAAAAWSRETKRRAKDFGQGIYWPRGQMTPARMPDFTNIMGDQP